MWPEVRAFLESHEMELVDEWPDVCGYLGDAVFVRRSVRESLLTQGTTETLRHDQRKGDSGVHKNRLSAFMRLPNRKK